MILEYLQVQKQMVIILNIKNRKKKMLIFFLLYGFY